MERKTLTLNGLKRKAAYNWRFCVMAAVAPQKILYGFERYYPAASAVEAPTS